MNQLSDLLLLVYPGSYNSMLPISASVVLDKSLQCRYFFHIQCQSSIQFSQNRCLASTLELLPGLLLRLLLVLLRAACSGLLPVICHNQKEANRSWNSTDTVLRPTENAF